MRGAAAARAARDGRAICIGRKTRASPPPRDIDSGTGKGSKQVVPETGTGKLVVSVPENGTGGNVLVHASDHRGQPGPEGAHPRFLASAGPCTLALNSQSPTNAHHGVTWLAT